MATQLQTFAALSLASLLLEEFERELPTTRKFLERVPEDQLLWQPHEKSLTAGQLALHIAVSPQGVIGLATPDEAAIPEFGGGFPQPQSIQEVLDALEQGSQVVQGYLSTVSDERLLQTLTLTFAGKPLLTMPRHLFLRNILLNHWYHHRGQLGVYLRLLGAKVPSSYGPSGDEKPDFLP